MEEKKIIKFDDIEMQYNSLLVKLKNNTLPEQYNSYFYDESYISYFMVHNLNSILIFKNPINIKLMVQSSIKYNFYAYTNIDIEKYCENKNIDIENLYFYDNIPYDKNKIKRLNFYISDNEIIFNLKLKEKLPSFILEPLLEINESYEVNKYSKYFSKDYFENDVNIKSKFIYIKNDIRDNFGFTVNVGVGNNKLLFLVSNIPMMLSSGSSKNFNSAFAELVFNFSAL